MRRLALLALAALPLLAQPAPAPEPAYPLRLSIPGVANAAQVSPVLYRGAQPTEEGFRELSKLGLKTILSMRKGHEDPKVLSGLGLFAFRVPSVQWRAESEDVVAALKVIATPSFQPVFVHCQAGRDRTGLVVAAYEVLYLGRPVDQAVAERRSYGAWGIWRSSEDFLERLKFGKVREDLLAMIESAPAPKPLATPTAP